MASNRDEFFSRPSLPGHFWAGQCNLLGGLDQEQGGTWLAICRQGKIAAVTNYRDPSQAEGKLSRGHLVRDFVASNQSARSYLASLTPSQYSGYNLLLGDAQQLFYSSNRGPILEPLSAGIYGLSNHLLNTPWPKLRHGKADFERAIHQANFNVERLFDVMLDDEPAADSDLPNTGIGLPAERFLSSRFIAGGDAALQQNPELANHSNQHRLLNYGTRTTTIVLMDNNGGGRWFERNHTLNSINRTKTVAFSW
ncbi:NRDE family protein [Halioxenophilus aromaticivorans]|uniref:NRDE family protein n=2 Tax=Halioxenophilus aromaticivorans TaxID=1306992 RepID=A0AAV3U1C7_9ALTE